MFEVLSAVISFLASTLVTFVMEVLYHGVLVKAFRAAKKVVRGFRLVLITSGLSFLLCCQNGSNESEMSTSNNLEDEVVIVKLDSAAQLMQAYIDSGVTVYNQAIKDAENGVPANIVKERYEQKAKEYQQQSIEVFESLQRDRQTMYVTDDQFNRLKSNVDVSEVQKKISELRQLGVDFELSEKK